MFVIFKTVQCVLAIKTRSEHDLLYLAVFEFKKVRHPCSSRICLDHVWLLF